VDIESWPSNKPMLYMGNARKLSLQAVDKVAASIQEYGFRQPIVVDKAGVIICGHTRLLAAQKLELATVPVHVAANLTPAQVRAYRLMDRLWCRFKVKPDSVGPALSIENDSA
jgi:ParB-like chromosome segregation protein Spo0J